MNRIETTELLSNLLKRDVLSGMQWASEVKYVKWNGDSGRVDFMAFRIPSQLYGATASAVGKGEFFCYEVKSCLEDYLSGFGLNFIAENNYLVMPMQLYKSLGYANELAAADVGVYVPLPYFQGKADTRYVYGEFEDPTPLTDDPSKWKLYKIRQQSLKANRRYSTAELLYAMLKAGRR